MAIIDPEFADRLLRYVAGLEAGETDEVIATNMGERRPRVRDHLIYIEEAQPECLKLQRFGNGAIMVVTTRARRDYISHFLGEGGFTAGSLRSQVDQTAETQRREQEWQKLLLEIEALRRQPGENKRTRRLSMLAIVIASLALAFEVVKALWFHS